MTTFTQMGDRMKTRELIHRDVLPARTYTVVRIDGRAFHTYTKGLERPFDAEFAAAMDHTATELLKEIPGAEFAYVQSDEISILITDFAQQGTQQWFGGSIQKIVSVTASLATAAFNEARPGKRALFDSRVLTLPSRGEVISYFGWRQIDAQRNAIQSLGQTLFTKREMHGMKARDIRGNALEVHGVHWEDQPAGFRNGRLVSGEHQLQTVTYTDPRTGLETIAEAMRRHWVCQPAFQFLDDANWEEGSPKAGLIPEHPDHTQKTGMLF